MTSYEHWFFLKLRHLLQKKKFFFQDNDSKNTNSSGELTPDMESTRVKSSLSIETFVISEPEEPKPEPNYPIRNKTREDFLWVTQIFLKIILMSPTFY